MSQHLIASIAGSSLLLMAALIALGPGLPTNTLLATTEQSLAQGMERAAVAPLAGNDMRIAGDRNTESGLTPLRR
jgi:hypothetical protein